MKCPNCGADVPLGDLFCGECGTQVVPEEEPKPSAPPSPAAQPSAEGLPKGLPKGLLIGCGGLLAVAVIVICIVVVIAPWNDKEPTPTATLVAQLPTQTSTPPPTDTPAPTATSTSTPAPTATFTSTPAPTATPMPTAAPTQTMAPAPSPTAALETGSPTAIPTPLLDLTDVVLTAEDLPAGFQEISPGDLGLTPESLSQEGFTVESLFLFMSAEQLEFVMGFTALIPTELERTGFDVTLKQPDLLLDFFISGMGATEILEQEQLTGLNDIGDASAGVTVVADMQGVPMRIDLAVFRRDIVGAFVFVMYLDGDAPLFSINDAARKLDARVLSAIE